MHRRSVFAITAAATMTGCKVLFPPLEPNGVSEPSDGTARAVLAPDTPMTTVDITRLRETARCENLTRGGSRIVVAKRCRPVGDGGVDEFAVSEQLDQVRRDQEELDRRRRELENRRGPGLY